MNPADVPALPVRIVRFFYTQNPFYLIGTFLVLFGLQQNFGQSTDLVKSLLFVGLLAGYTLLLSTLAIIIIRGGQVWDDARTMLLVIVLMFFMLSSSLDVHVLYEPLPGSALLLLALAFSVVVSEGLLRLLRIHLAAMYRGPYYLMLTLLFTYPILLTWLSFYEYYPLLSWALYAFPAFAGMVLLTLLPAARHGAHREPASGTPWRWPYYPWSLFVFLTVGVGIRSWWLTLAFQWTEGQDYIFQPYFLAPLVLAWSALVLEMGLARGHRRTIVAGLAMPVLTLVTAFPGLPSDGAALDFVQLLTSTIGSPAQIVIGGLVSFYAFACLRHVRAAEAMLAASALVAAVVDRGTLSLDQLTAPQPLIVGGIALGMLAVGIVTRTSWRVLLGGGLIACAAPFWLPTQHPVVVLFWSWHLPVLLILAVSLTMDDKLASALRAVAWRLTPLLAVVAALGYPWFVATAPMPAAMSYLAVLAILSAGYWYRDKREPQLVATLLCGSANGAAHLRQLYLLLEGSLLAKGLPWLAAGLAIVMLAFAISLLKMGLWRQLGPWLVWANRRLAGG